MDDNSQYGDTTNGPRVSSRREFVLGIAAIPLLSGAAVAQQPNSNDLQKPPPNNSLNDLVQQLPKLKVPMVPQKFMVPMRDGVKLALDVYFPTGDGPWPVVLERTPYSRRQPFMFELFHFFPEAGFALAVQDCRGRFDSEGVYRPFLDDMEDGFDTVEWLAVQPWSTGKIGMTGASAMGIVSYEAAMAQPPHLLAASVFCARNPSPTLSRFPGGLYLEDGVSSSNKTFGLAEQDAKVPHIAEFNQDDFRVDLRRYYSKIKVPFIHLGGWFDIHEQPILDNFIHFQAEAAKPARGHQKLIMAACGHLGAVKGVKFPGEPGGPFVPQETALRWFSHWLIGEENGIMAEPAVRYYLMGDTLDPKAPGNEWREGPTWPPNATATPFYFHEDGTLSLQPPKSSARRTYVYDPSAAVPTMGGNNLLTDSGPLDQRPVSARPDVLRFIGEPLEAATEVVGHLHVDLWVSTDALDTDFIVKLIDIHPNGHEALVRDQGARLRHYKGQYTQTRTEPGKVYPLTIDLWSTALVFNKGHRIGVLVQSSNWPRFERHTNTWDRVANYEQAVRASNTVHMGPGHTSRITLPITKVYRT
jgi:predicted acyl esterase